MALWDTIVIGAGIEGSATGYALVKRNKRVLILEQFALPHTRGSSNGNSRITRLAYAEKHYTQMMVDGFRLWSELEQEVSTPLYEKKGIVTTSSADNAELAAIESSLQCVGAKVERLQGETLANRFPMLTFDDSIAAVLDESGGILRANKCLNSFQEAFRRRGGVIHDSEPVLQVIPIDVSSVRVKTSRDEYTAKSIIITAGPWTSRLTEHLGLHLPLQPKRVLVWYWKQLNERAYGHANDGSPIFLYIDGHRELYGLPSLEYPGLVKVAYHGGTDCDPDARDTVNNDELLDYVAQFVGKHLRGVEAKPSLTEACIYTLTPDSDFILDHHPQWKNIVIGAGFSGHGFKFAPVVGEILADLAINGLNDKYEMHHFRINRFDKS